MSETAEGGGSKKPEDICRDFLRNVCRRGDRCKFSHPTERAETETEGPRLQDKMEFCHDFQNNRCSRNLCKFIHCSSDVEAEFKKSGYLPPVVRDQVINKGIAVDFPATTYNGVPICKDYLKGLCVRDTRCKFRHLNPMEYDLEMNAYQSRRRPTPFGLGHYFDEDEAGVGMFERRGRPDRKRRCLEGPYSEGGPPPHAFQMVQEENLQLRTQIQELEKRVSDLTATNEFLLDQNAQLRMGVKPAASVSTPGVPVSGLAGWPGVDFS